MGKHLLILFLNPKGCADYFICREGWCVLRIGGQDNSKRFGFLLQNRLHRATNEQIQGTVYSFGFATMVRSVGGPLDLGVVLFADSFRKASESRSKLIGNKQFCPHAPDKSFRF